MEEDDVEVAALEMALGSEMRSVHDLTSRRSPEEVKTEGIAEVIGYETELGSEMRWFSHL